MNLKHHMNYHTNQETQIFLWIRPGQEFHNEKIV